MNSTTLCDDTLAAVEQVGKADPELPPPPATAEQRYYLKKQAVPEKSDKKTFIMIPHDFDISIYRELHQDLKSKTDDELVIHYAQYGRKEKRLYKLNLPPDFDPNEYRALNGDLDTLTNDQLKVHYQSYGKNEGRKYRLQNYQNSFNNLYAATAANSKSLTRKFTEIDLKDVNLEQAPNFVRSASIIHADRCINRNFTLVVDYDETFTGGTSFFYDILSYYYQNIRGCLVLRIRPSGTKYCLYINNLKVNAVYSLEEIKHFVTAHSKNGNIQHVFINSVVGHKEEFLEHIFSLPQTKSIFTHDYSIVIDINQPTFQQLAKVAPPKLKNILGQVDVIYTQNQENINIIKSIPCIGPGLSKSISEKAVVVDMPDFFEAGELRESKTSKFTFGVIGNISDVKGLKLMIDIKNFFASDETVRFFNFGKNTIKVPSQEYKTISELNDLLTTVKPNALLFLALWPETYSYTLTLSLLTELPLYVFDIGACPVKRRIFYWPNCKAVKFFKNPEELAEAVAFERVSRLRLIKEKVRVSDSMDFAFGPRARAQVTPADPCTDASGLSPQKSALFFKNVCLITSKVSVTDVSYNYSKRSKYTVDERLSQTIDTIASVRSRIPDCFIIFIDHSEFRENPKWSKIVADVDLLISNSNQIMKWNCDHNTFKIYGELYQTIFVLRVIKASSIDYKNFFKLSGRYKLNDNFNYEKFDNSKCIFKRNANVCNRLYFYTSLYKLSRESFDLFYKLLHKIYTEIMIYETNQDFESRVPLCLDISEVDELGVTQYISCFVEGEQYI